MDQPVAKAKASPIRLVVSMGVILLAAGALWYGLGAHSGPREVWVQDELGRPVLGAIAQSIDSRGPQPVSENVAVSDVNGVLRLPIRSSVDYSVAKDNYEPARFPGSALAVPDAAGVDYSVKNGHFTVTLREKSSEVQLLDAKKMWQEGVLDPLNKMPLTPDKPAPDQPTPANPPSPNPSPANSSSAPSPPTP
jgi:hypothetical protein